MIALVVRCGIGLAKWAEPGDSVSAERAVRQGGRILVGTDFSDGAARALATARRFARSLGAELEVVHVVEAHGDAGWSANDATARWLEDGGVEPDTLVVRSGSPWVELVRYARESKPLMIVVGSHGASGFQPLTLGSTAVRMGVVSPFPLLVVTGSTRSRRNPGAALGSMQT